MNAQQQFLTLQEIVFAARRNLAPGPWNYLIGATETETTQRRNRQALDSIAFRPRVLNDVSKVDSRASFLGQSVRLPVMLAPVGGMESFAEGAAAAAAKGAAEFGIPQMLSSVCQPGLEATAAAAKTIRAFQLYVRGDEAWIDDHVKRAKDNGYTAFCLTVDSASYSRRERDLLIRFVKPWRPLDSSGMTFQAALSWDHVKRFKDNHDMPLILKGIATAEDAELAVAHGVEVVYVSNHGGRQLDSAPSAIAALPAIRQAVGPTFPLLFDSGIRTGDDMVKARALGADMVLVGRPFLYALAAVGPAGAERMYNCFTGEIETALAQIGVAAMSAVTPACLYSAPLPA